VRFGKWFNGKLNCWGKSGHPPFTGIDLDQNWIDDDDDGF